MGISKLNIDLVNEAMRLAKETFGSNLYMCELGNQKIRSDCRINHVLAKKHFKSLGIKHVSLDLNGKDGAVQVDLSMPINRELLHDFDIVTDYGTLEHVFVSQYYGFKNVHDLCRKDGFMVHALPRVNAWKKHCKFWYTTEFITELAGSSGYEVLINETRHRAVDTEGKKTMVCALLKKSTDKEFITPDQFTALKGRAW